LEAKEMKKELKKVDWQKKYENLKKGSERNENVLRDHITGLSKKETELTRELQDKRKGYIITIEAQSFIIKDYAQAQEKVRKLLDAGVWYFSATEKH